MVTRLLRQLPHLCLPILAASFLAVSCSSSTKVYPVKGSVLVKDDPRGWGPCPPSLGTGWLPLAWTFPLAPQSSNRTGPSKSKPLFRARPSRVCRKATITPRLYGQRPRRLIQKTRDSERWAERSCRPQGQTGWPLCLNGQGHQGDHNKRRKSDCRLSSFNKAFSCATAEKYHVFQYLSILFWRNCHVESDVLGPESVYSDRVARRHCDHRDPNRLAFASRSEGSRGGSAQ